VGFVALGLAGHGGISIARLSVRVTLQGPLPAQAFDYGCEVVQGIFRLRLCFAFAKHNLRSK